MYIQNRQYLQRFRHIVQWAVLCLVIYSGYNFYLFIGSLASGGMPPVSRPASIEGFLPIGGLMALKLWITTGIFDAVHPASLVIFCGALILSLLLRKSFCGWICPIGTVSDVTWKIGRKILGRNFTLPKYPDYFLRSLKYVLMAFFLYIIVIKMSPSEIAGFLETPYWTIIDVKMMMFFTEASVTVIAALVILLVLSMLFKNFWCRYLCPYGALLGLLGHLSPLRIQRNDNLCTQCNACSMNCPSNLPVNKELSVLSPECSACLTCISSCRSTGALDVTIKSGTRLHPAIVGVSVIVIFFGLIMFAELSGRWNSSLTNNDLRVLLSNIAYLSHP